VSDFEDDYVAGDVNRIDGEVDRYDDDDDEVTGPDRVNQSPTAAAVLDYLARALADEPDVVAVDAREQGNRVMLSLSVAPGDMGRVIGRRGRTAQALRTLVAAAGARDGVTTAVDIVD
jgi:uncharacterized protein